jgi:FixJ family two-component response regulator
VAEPKDVVFVVDDDPCVCAAVAGLLRSAGLSSQSFSSARDFLDSPALDVPACLVLDVDMPGTDGLELQRELIARELSLPIVFITGRGDIPMSVRAMKAGAIEFLPKPFRDTDLLQAVGEALDGARRARAARAQHAQLRARQDSLTPRQRQVLELVVDGLLNKQIAHQLGISEMTVKIHRGLVMKKMRANSIADLVRMVEQMGLRPQAT